MKCTIGIDPGVDGAIAAIVDTNNPVVSVWPMPTMAAGKGDKREVDVVALSKIIRDITAGCDTRLACVERVSARPGQGVTSMFSFGQTCGSIKTTVRLAGIPLVMMTPQAWKKVVLAGTDKSKEAAVAYVRSKYPMISLKATPRCTTDHDGMAEAICMAEYGSKL